MSPFKFDSAVQVVSTFAILLGISLVMWELKQTRDITTAQLVSDNLITRMQTNIALMGDDPMAAVSKACSPDQLLTDKEFRIANLYLQTKFLETIRRIEIAKVSGLFNESNWQEVASFEFMTIAGSEFGRWWWQNVREGYKSYYPELTAYGDKLISETPESNCDSSFKLYSEHFQRDA